MKSMIGYMYNYNCTVKHICIPVYIYIVIIRNTAHCRLLTVISFLCMLRRGSFAAVIIHITSYQGIFIIYIIILNSIL